LHFDQLQVNPVKLFSFIICLIVGAISCFAFGGLIQAYNPFPNDFRVQAYGIAFIAAFLICRLLIPAALIFAGYLMALMRSSR
jgi:hypothetical protein